MNTEKQLERQEKITAGLKVAYERMLEFKRRNNSVIVVALEEKVVRMKP